MEQTWNALRSGAITLYRITEANADAVHAQFRAAGADDDYLRELDDEYLPQYDDTGRQRTYGFYSTLHDALAGLSLLDVDSLPDARGSTGADTLPHMRGRGVAPGSKPHLFYLGFALLGLNRIETGCFVSNRSSKRSIEKTAGFRFEGTLREYERNEDGEFEDVHYYAILHRDWLALYNPDDVTVLP